MVHHNYPILSDVHSSLSGEVSPPGIWRKVFQSSIVFVEGRGGWVLANKNKEALLVSTAEKDRGD